jgi:uncharacterized damage-inducible protein DinB
MGEAPSLGPSDVRVVTGTEREVLEGFLELYRGLLPRKVAGLGEDEARRSLVPSRTTLIALLKHLASVEREWFGMVLGGRPAGELGIRADDGWVVGPEDAVPGVLDEYRQACEDSRVVAARFGLDDTVPHAQFGSVSLRWIYVHMIEESARHAGHADILREQTDGSTGFD